MVTSSARVVIREPPAWMAWLRHYEALRNRHTQAAVPKYGHALNEGGFDGVGSRSTARFGCCSPTRGSEGLVARGGGGGRDVAAERSRGWGCRRACRCRVRGARCARSRMWCSPSRRLSGSLAAGMLGLPAGSARARRHRRPAAALHGAPAGAVRGGGPGVGCDRGPGRGGRCGRSGRLRGELVGRGGGQIRCLSLLVVGVACHRPDRTSSPLSVQSRGPAERSRAGGRSTVPGLGAGTPCPGTRGESRSSRRCPLPRLGRPVCLPSAASSAPTQRSGQALPFGSLRESCRTRA